jgi:hypothetical protein
MLFTIPRHRHRARPLYWLKWWPVLFRPAIVARQVQFTFASKYLVEGGDQQDHNKLFGLCFGKTHELSARYGWRYEPSIDRFILSAYCYLNGERHMYDLCECKCFYRYNCQLFITATEYVFRVTDEHGQVLANEHISKGHRRKWALLLGTYFGGNQSAPVQLELEMKKI